MTSGDKVDCRTAQIVAIISVSGWQDAENNVQPYRSSTKSKISIFSNFPLGKSLNAKIEIMPIIVSESQYSWNHELTSKIFRLKTTLNQLETKVLTTACPCDTGSYWISSGRKRKSADGSMPRIGCLGSSGEWVITSFCGARRRLGKARH